MTLTIEREYQYMKNRRLAVIDLGTNTFHLLIAEITPQGNYKIFFKEKAPVMIGKNGISHGIIREDAQQRAIHTLKGFRSILDKEQVGQIYATATSAFRNAKNGVQLVDKIKKETGIEVQVITGDQEADYIFFGVHEALHLTEENALIIDIGGGSVEFIICNSKAVLWKQSFEIGAQRLLDQFHITDPISQENVQALLQFFDQRLKDLDAACQQFEPQTLIGASGAFDTLSDIYAHKEGISLSEDLTELPLTYERFIEIHEEIVQKNREERLKIPGMIEMRVDMIVVASWLIHYVLHRYQITNIRVSAYALKEGLLRNVIDHFITANQS